MKSFALIVAALGPAALVSTLGRLSVDAAWVQRLGWTLIHTVWQFALIALLAAVLQWSLRRRSARARYATGVGLLGAMAVSPCVTCCVVDVARPSAVKHARLAPTRTPHETPSSNALPFPRSPMDESDASESPVREPGATPPRRHAAEPLATVRAHVPPHERPSLSWIAAFHSTLAPRLPLLVSLWLAGMALFALRPVWGLWMQWRLRRVGLSPVPASVTQCLDDLARRLGLRRTVGIAQSVRVGVPMAVGYLRPLILLPGCVLTGLTAAQLEALLAHELAHIRRHDWLVNAFQLLVETVFFYHPAVWWLSRQIRQERENCCDDLAVSLVGDRGTVGRMLLALEELREQTPALSLAATRGNLLGRVRRVVAKGRQPEPAGREWLPAAVLLLLAGLGGAAWAMSAETTEKKGPALAAPAATAKAGGPKDFKSDAKNNAGPSTKTPDVRRVTGRVVDGNGQPVSAARLWWVVLHFSLNDEFTVTGTSDAQGRFALEAPAAWKPRRATRPLADMLWVLAPGKDLKVVRATDGLTVDGKESPFTVSLAPATETEYEIRDEQGHPAVGVVVEPRQFATRGMWCPFPTALRELLRKTTDQSGRVRLTSLPREDFRTLDIRAPGFGTQQQRLDGPDEASPKRKVTLRQTGTIEGRLIADDPQWVRGVNLLFRTERRKYWSPAAVPETDGEAVVETDEQGRFRIPAIATGAASIRVGTTPTKSPLAPRLPSDVWVTAGENVHVEIPMEKLVRVKGTIRTDDTQAPVVGAEVIVHYGEGSQADDVTSDSQGHYEARVLPGPVRTQVVFVPRETRYVEVGESWNKRIQVPPGLNEFELPPIVLSPTESHTGTLIDQDGRPIAGAYVSGIRGNRRYGFAETNGSGEFSLQLPKKLGMDRYEVGIPGRHLGSAKPTIIKHEPLTLQFDNFVILLDLGKERFDRMGENFQGKPLRSAPQP